MPLNGPGRDAPLRVHGGLLYVPVRLGDRRCWAQLDTGSKGMIIAPRLAVGLPSIGRSVLRGVLGETPTVRVRLPGLEFLGRWFRGLTAKVGPNGGLGVPWSGLLLGTDVLLARPLVLDMGGRRVSAPQNPPRASTDEVYRLAFHRGRSFLKARVGSRTLRATLDTGCSDCILNARLSPAPARRLRSDVAIDASGGRARWDLYDGLPVDLGHGRLGRFRFVRADLHRAERGLGRPVDFVVGANLLRGAGGIWSLTRSPPELRRSRPPRPSADRPRSRPRRPALPGRRRPIRSHRPGSAAGP